MPHNLFPGFATAGSNGSLITAPELPECPVAHTVSGEAVPLSGWHSARLAVARDIAHFLEPMSLDYDPDLSLPADWPELQAQTQDMFVRFTKPFGSSLPINDEHGNSYTRAQLLHATRSATWINTALAEVIPRLRFNEDFTSPNTALAATARETVPLLVSWMATHGAADAGLTYGLAYPKPKDLNNPYSPYLRFHTKWFELVGNAVGLRAEKIPDLVGEPVQDKHTKKIGTFGRHPNHPVRPDMILFGCPARKHVAGLFRIMVERAEQADLFGISYQAARREHGYVA